MTRNSFTADEETDCFGITEAVSRLAGHYRQFGVGLGLLPSKIDEIERLRKTPTTVNDKFSQVVTLRLNQLPSPTWKTFIDAAIPINRALAESMRNFLWSYNINM